MRLIFYSFLIYLAIADERYTTKYDNIDIDAVISTERLLQNYIKCLLDLVVCTEEGSELKKNMPDAIQNDCSKCSDKQKEGSDKLILYLINNKPEYWQLLEEKYDPTGENTKKFIEFKRMMTERTAMYATVSK
uniref:Chemosensory protein CSP1 n=1 Tax=Holotrichia oblita TaxID=644536 RepID=G9BWI4_HOLOL|nr:chemosensory protein CSP1 [Holotrichia oblita]